MPTSAVEVPEEATKEAFGELKGLEPLYEHDVERALEAVWPAIEHSCRKRFEEELLSEAARLEVEADKILDPTARSLRLLRVEAIREALQATREGASDER